MDTGARLVARYNSNIKIHLIRYIQYTRLQCQICTHEKDRADLVSFASMKFLTVIRNTFPVMPIKMAIGSNTTDNILNNCFLLPVSVMGLPFKRHQIHSLFSYNIEFHIISNFINPPPGPSERFQVGTRKILPMHVSLFITFYRR